MLLWLTPISQSLQTPRFSSHTMCGVGQAAPHLCCGLGQWPPGPSRRARGGMLTVLLPAHPGSHLLLLTVHCPEYLTHCRKGCEMWAHRKYWWARLCSRVCLCVCVGVWMFIGYWCSVCRCTWAFSIPAASEHCFYTASVPLRTCDGPASHRVLH